MLNAVLTVREHRPNSHRDKGWEVFTDAIIRVVDARDGVVFVLWGNYAKKKRDLIVNNRERIVEAAQSITSFGEEGVFSVRDPSRQSMRH